MRPEIKHNEALLAEGFVIEGPAGTKCAVP